MCVIDDQVVEDREFEELAGQRTFTGLLPLVFSYFKRTGLLRGMLLNQNDKDG